MLYVAGKNVYSVGIDGEIHPADITAKDKVVEGRELESITVKPHEEVVELPEGARPATTDEITRKFNLSQKNPIKFDQDFHDELFVVEEVVTAPEGTTPGNETDPENTSTTNGEGDEGNRVSDTEGDGVDGSEPGKPIEGDQTQGDSTLDVPAQGKSETATSVEDDLAKGDVENDVSKSADDKTTDSTDVVESKQEPDDEKEAAEAKTTPKATKRKPKAKE